MRLNFVFATNRELKSNLLFYIGHSIRLDACVNEKIQFFNQMTRKLLILNGSSCFDYLMSRPEWDAVNQIAVVNIYHQYFFFFPFDFQFNLGIIRKDDVFFFDSFYSLSMLCTNFIVESKFKSESSSHKKSIAAYSFFFFGRSNLHIVNIFDFVWQ